MSFPRYPNYKDSGVEWLGEVPGHWEVKQLKFLCDIQTGDKDTVDAVEDGIYPFFVRSQTVERINSCAFDCEAVLTAGDGVGVGKVFHYHNGPFDFHQRVYMLNKFREVSGQFLFQFLRENFYKVALAGGAKSTVDSLRRPLFTNFALAFPPADEQGSIVEFVERESSKIDELLTEQRRLMELLKEKRQAVISHAVTKGLNPNAPMKPSGIEWLGDVPEHWTVMSAKRVSSIFVPQRNKPDLNAEGDGLFWVTMDQMRSEEINSAELSVTESAARAAGTRALPAGSVVASCVGTFGLAAINNVDVIINQQLQAFIPTDRVDARFMRHCILIAEGYFEQIGTAATIAYVNQLGFANMPMALPPKLEQHQIVQFLVVESAKFDTLTAEAQRAIALLQERRTALISAAVTGQIDVRQQ